MSERLDAGDSDPPPEAPPAPEAGECCRSGCERCVYDVYWEAMERYEVALQAWKRRHGMP
jgi:hypothetical protein